MVHSHASSFCVVGQFLGCELKGHRIHCINLQHEAELYRLRLSNSAQDDLLRAALASDLQLGDWIQVSGLQENSPEHGLELIVHAFSRCKKKIKAPGAYLARGSDF